MLGKSRDYASQKLELKLKSPVYEFVQGSSEDLNQVLSDESVDLLLAAVRRIELFSFRTHFIESSENPQYRPQISMCLNFPRYNFVYFVVGCVCY